MVNRIVCGVAASMLLSALMHPVLVADRGMIPVIPGVSIYEPGQKAIIAWNGKKEILILSTDVYAEGETKVLEILPLPAEPDVEKGSFESFEAIQRLIREHAPTIFPGRPDGKLSSDGESGGINILFHKEIGAHSITCVRASDSDEFMQWVSEYVKEHGIPSVEVPDTISSIVEKYIRNRFHFFVFDITEINTEEQSVEPLVYTFKTDYLFFPLEITSLLEGETAISLFLLTKEPMELWETGTGMRPGTYYRHDYMRLPEGGTEGAHVHEKTRDMNVIDFSLSPKEQKEILPEIDLMFWGNIYLGVLQYHGSTKVLRNDLLLQ